MLKYAIILFGILAGIAVLSGYARMRRVLWVLAALAILYTILKLTGGIEALVPDR